MAKEFRINGFKQIERFYSIVFNNGYEVKPQHVSLYMFLLNQCNRSGWVEWFKCPYDLAMNGACIGSKKTYYSTLEDLKKWKLIKYEAGLNGWAAPKIHLIYLSENAPLSVPLSEPVDAPLPTPLPIQVDAPLSVPLPTPLPIHIYKLLTSNISNYITSNWNILKDSGEFPLPAVAGPPEIKIEDEKIEYAEVVIEAEEKNEPVIDTEAYTDIKPEPTKKVPRPPRLKKDPLEKYADGLWPNFRQAYVNWYEEATEGLKPQVRKEDYSALKKIVEHLKENISRENTYADALKIWVFILKHWQLWDPPGQKPFHQNNKLLTQINSAITNIIANIKNAPNTYKQQQQPTLADKQAAVRAAVLKQSANAGK